MRINPIGVGSIRPEISTPIAKPTSAGGPDSFGATLKGAVQEVNNLQVQADKVGAKLATGNIEDVHQAMIAMQKASLAMQFTVQVRNKVVEAYQEIMRTQL